MEFCTKFFFECESQSPSYIAVLQISQQGSQWSVLATTESVLSTAVKVRCALFNGENKVAASQDLTPFVVSLNKSVPASSLLNIWESPLLIQELISRIVTFGLLSESSHETALASLQWRQSWQRRTIDATSLLSEATLMVKTFPPANVNDILFDVAVILQKKSTINITENDFQYAVDLVDISMMAEEVSIDNVAKFVILLMKKGCLPVSTEFLQTFCSTKSNDNPFRIKIQV